MCTQSLLSGIVSPGKDDMNLLCPLKTLSFSPLYPVKMTLQAYVFFPMEKKMHLERLKWLWERIHIQERIQNGGHKSALWILGKAEEEFRVFPFLCSCSMLCNDWKSIFPLTTEISSKVSTVPKLKG